MKKKFIAISTTLMLGVGGIITVPAVKAETSSQIKNKLNQEKKNLSDLQSKRAELEAQITRINKAIKDNKTKINETNNKLKETQAEVDQLNKEIAVIQERIIARTEILKERAVSFQENGGQISYIEVILGSSSFADFIDRVGAVASFVEADKGIIEEHQADKAELETKQNTVKTKLNELKEMKIELEGMQDQIKEQKEQSEELKQQLTKRAKDSSNAIASLQDRLNAQRKLVLSVSSNVASSSSSNSYKAASASISDDSSAPTGSGKISTVINAGNRYIGNSVYVFGGGRTQSDIENGRFDCSGFVAWAFSQAGIKVVAHTDSLKNTGTRVSTSEMRPGDLVFFDTYKQDGHVGIYLGGGKFIGSQSSTGVAVADMTSGYYAKRFNGRVMRIIN